MITWRAPEFQYYEKDVSWYWLVTILGIVVLAAAFWQKNFLFAIFIIIAWGTVLVWGNRKPKKITIELDESGIKVEKNFYPKEKFAHFFIIRGEEEWDRLILKPKSKLSQLLSFAIPHEEFDKVRKYCLNFWTETELPESLVDQLADFFKF